MTTAKKTPAKKTDAEATTPAPGEKFEIFRQRAFRTQGKNAGITANEEPFVLTVEQGFEEEISLERPDFPTRLSIESALERGSAITVLQLVFSEHLGEIIDQLSAYEQSTGNAPEAVITGIVQMYLEHFFGKSAREVFTKLSI